MYRGVMIMRSGTIGKQHDRALLCVVVYSAVYCNHPYEKSQLQVKTVAADGGKVSAMGIDPETLREGGCIKV